MRRLLIIICLLLSACGDWPDAGGPALERSSREWPTLLPLSDVIAGGTVNEAADNDATQLAARAAGLRNRARILRANASDADAMEALRARLRR